MNIYIILTGVFITGFLCFTGIATASSTRVKLQAFSKKTTFMVGSECSRIGSEAEERLFEDAVGALVHASEDSEDGVRQALAELLPVIPVDKGNPRELSTDLTEHALDFLIDLMHDETGTVSAAAAAGLLTMRESNAKVLPFDSDHVHGLLSCMDSSEPMVRYAVRALIDSGSIVLPSQHISSSHHI